MCPLQLQNTGIAFPRWRVRFDNDRVKQEVIDILLTKTRSNAIALLVNGEESQQ